MTVNKKRQRPSWRQRSCASVFTSAVSVASLTLISSQLFITSNGYIVAPPPRSRKDFSHKSSPHLETLTTSEESKTQGSWLSTNHQGADEFKLPPWLSRFEKESEDRGNVRRQIEWLEYSLLEQEFTPRDVRDVVNAMESAAAGDLTKFLGMIEFCHLLLSLEEPVSSADQHIFATKEVLLASILHYGDCVGARQTGVYELVKQACEQHAGPRGDRLLPARGSRETELETEDLDDVIVAKVSESIPSSTETIQKVDSALSKAAVTSEIPSSGFSGMSETNTEVLRIAKGAARIKQVEILAHAVLGEGRTPSLEQASRLRAVLLSVMDDWRALAIRSAASLFRLEGIFSSTRGTAEYMGRTPQVIQTARDALRIYAPIAQRLGMHRLKSRLEGLAFRLLYRRQYEAVSSLYRQSGATWDAREAMQSVSTYLTKHITQLLQADEKLMGELDNLQVTSRVKEPYSLWKKLLKSRKTKLPRMEPLPLLEGSSYAPLSTEKELSVLEVLDAVALRIVVKAKKWTPDEPDNVTRDRERLLCYYVQKVIRDYWPATDERRIKDYIRAPKPNGYQSLHYTSSVSCLGEDWPFEVQVRSEEMHRIAEYGVAAHWDYKLKGNKKLPQTKPSQVDPNSFLDTPTAVIEADASSVSVVTEDDTQQKIRSDKGSNPMRSYIDALVTAREDLLETKVFVFLVGSPMAEGKGQILSLPVGSTVVDALALLEAQTGQKLPMDGSNKVPQVFRNGRLAQLHDFVGTGDLLLVNL